MFVKLSELKEVEEDMHQNQNGNKSLLLFK